MEWFYHIPGVEDLDCAESFFDFFSVPYDITALRNRCLPVLSAFHRKLNDNVPLRNLLEDDPHASWQLARRLLAESYQQQITGGSV